MNILSDGSLADKRHVPLPSNMLVPANWQKREFTKLSLGPSPHACSHHTNCAATCRSCPALPQNPGNLLTQGMYVEKVFSKDFGLLHEMNGDEGCLAEIQRDDSVCGCDRFESLPTNTGIQPPY